MPTTAFPAIITALRVGEPMAQTGPLFSPILYGCYVPRSVTASRSMQHPMRIVALNLANLAHQGVPYSGGAICSYVRLLLYRYSRLRPEHVLVMYP